MWDKVIVMTVTLGVTSFKPSVSEPLSGVNKWQRPTLISQDYTGILIGIEQRLRGVDSLRHTVSRTEISLQSLSNRLDLIETRLQTVQSSLQHTLDAVSTAVKSSEMKYELLLDQLSRKVEAGFDRLQHKLNGVESRSESTINKLQNQIDVSFGRVDKKQNSMGSDIMRISTNMELVRSQLSTEEEKNNQTLQTLVGHFQEIHLEHGAKREHLKNITSLLRNLQGNRSESLAQNDAPILPEEGLKIIRSEISNEGHRIGAKMHNMYNDLWRTVKDLEVIIRSGFEETNSTNRNLYNKLTEMLLEEQKNSESFMDVVMRSVLTHVGDLLDDLQRQTDNRYKELRNSQEKHGESCYKIKNVLENSVALILEKIYDTFTNRSDRFSKQIFDMAEILKAHNKQLVQSTTETRSLFVTLAEETSQDHKQLDSSITDVSETCQDLQIQTQEINDLFMKNQLTIREIKNLLVTMKRNNVEDSAKGLQNGDIHAIEANFTNGVINIKTNHSTQTPDSTVPPNEKNLEKGISLATLDKSISTSGLVAVIGESRNKENEDSENTKKVQEKGGEVEDTEEMKKDLDKGYEEEDFDVQEETRMEDEKPVDTTQLLLAYIKLLHGNLSPNEFLAEAIPGNTYETFDDMIQHLKKAGNVPRETIHDIKQLAQEQNYKDSHQTDSEVRRIIRKLNQDRDVENEEDNVNYDDED